MSTNFNQIAETSIPSSRFKQLRVVGFESDGIEALCLISGDLSETQTPLVRVHSQCLFGEVFHSLKCDCLEQLHRALDRIQAEPPGMVIYLFQEGRGAGLLNKIKGYRLSEQGLDTVEAYEKLNLPIDNRDYKIAADILHHFGISEVRLLTNNPDKIAQLGLHGIRVSERVAITVPANPHDLDYLRTKMTKLNHLLSESLAPCS